ncbi:MAG: hypothetical protein PHR98_00690 [Candidatus Shapirobacteria bacterium]|nr:hypothetical protein [Candidatus Shapirobacteria bacterium]
MSKKGKEALKAYQERKNKNRQAVLDGQNPGYRQRIRFTESFKFIDQNLSKLPDTRDTNLYFSSNF